MAAACGQEVASALADLTAFACGQAFGTFTFLGQRQMLLYLEVTSGIDRTVDALDQFDSRSCEMMIPAVMTRAKETSSS